MKTATQRSRKLPFPSAMVRAYFFFRQYGGGVVGEDALRSWRLARAEEYADAQEWTFTWEYDPSPDLSWCDDCAKRSHLRPGHEHPEVFTCLLRDESGKALASLGSIEGDRNYRRVVQAELALEAMPAQLDLAL